MKRMDSVEEDALIDRCRRQDIDAFGKFVDLYQSRVHGFVRRIIGNQDEAADLTQEVFIRAFQKFDRFDKRSSLKTWLFRIAHNLCIDQSRRRIRAPIETGFQMSAEPEDTLEIPDERWAPERIAIEQELADAIEEAIGTMSEKLRIVLLLHDKEDASYQEIAEIMKLPIGTVKSRLFLARAHLQASLTPYLAGEVL